MDRGNGSVLKAGWAPAWVAVVLAIALAGLPAAAVVHAAAQDGGTALAFPSTVRSSAPSVLGASGSRGLVPSEASPVPGVGWEALSHASNGLSPPDVQVAVGPDHIVEAVNSALGIYTKLGASVTNTNLSTLFSSGSDLVGDPRILYAAFAGRWFVSAGDISRGQVLVAVSKTGDPAGNWSTYQVPSVPTSSCLDQPVLGVGTWNLIVSVNAFSSCTSPPYTFEGSQYWVMNKTDLVAGVANPATSGSPMPSGREVSFGSPSTTSAGRRSLGPRARGSSNSTRKRMRSSRISGSLRPCATISIPRSPSMATGTSPSSSAFRPRPTTRGSS